MIFDPSFDCSNNATLTTCFNCVYWTSIFYYVNSPIVISKISRLRKAKDKNEHVCGIAQGPLVQIDMLVCEFRNVFLVFGLPY